MTRIRTIPGAVEEIKAQDPNSHINVPMLRRWVKRGLIPVVPVGGKTVLVDMAKIEQFLQGANNEDL